jgi:hypothetical protein
VRAGGGWPEPNPQQMVTAGGTFPFRAAAFVGPDRGMSSESGRMATFDVARGGGE